MAPKGLAIFLSRISWTGEYVWAVCDAFIISMVLVRPGTHTLLQHFGVCSMSEALGASWAGPAHSPRASPALDQPCWEKQHRAGSAWASSYPPVLGLLCFMLKRESLGTGCRAELGCLLLLYRGLVWDVYRRMSQGVVQKLQIFPRQRQKIGKICIKDISGFISSS